MTRWSGHRRAGDWYSSAQVGPESQIMSTPPRIGPAWLISATLAVAFAACSTVEVDYYKKITDGAVDLAYIKPDADFGRYTALKADPLEIYFSQASAPSQAELERIRTTFREAFLGEIAGDYPIVDKAGPGVLAVRASLIDSKTTGTSVPVRGQLAALVSSGNLTFLMELRDSKTNEVLARAGDQEKPAAGSDDTTSWDEVSIAADRWAKLFRNFLDNNLGKPPATTR